MNSISFPKANFVNSKPISTKFDQIFANKYGKINVDREIMINYENLQIV
jgi:hypothetical protein